MKTPFLTALVVLAWAVAQAPEPKHHSDTVVSNLCLRQFAMPLYPEAARRYRTEGEVMVTLNLHSDGTVAALSDVQGPDALAAEVKDQLKKWQFMPPVVEGTRLTVDVRFSLYPGPEMAESSPSRVSGVLPGLIEVKANPPSSQDQRHVRRKK
jgi:TonB family protein